VGTESGLKYKRIIAALKEISICTKEILLFMASAFTLYKILGK
jgi:hypothetical protein